MKKIVTTPIIITYTLLTISCGSGPKKGELETQRIINEMAQVPVQQTVSINQPVIPVNSAIPLAGKVAGRPGFVFNPYNQNMVEVNGLLPGTKVRDPLDPDPSHVFIVP